MTSFLGQPCWFELMTNDTDQATVFYSGLMGWNITDSGMPDMTYLLAAVGQAMVAGISPNDQMGDNPPPPNWACYVAVDDCDATVEQSNGLGGGVIVPPTDIPGTGRFAMLTDPQGAVFGILQPLPMADPQVSAFSADHVGHAQWIELMTPDQSAGFDYYAALFGWKRGGTIPMGPMGEYWIFSYDGADIGGMMAQADAPVPAWTPYFGVDSVDAAVEELGDNGGSVHHGPTEVPGGQWTAICTDPQGAFFGVVGAK